MLRKTRTYMKNYRFSVSVAKSQSRWPLSGQLAVMSEISWCDAGASAGQPEIVATLLRCCGRGSLGGVSYDFAVIPVDLITSPEQAARLDVAMCEEVKQPAPRDVEEFVAELHRKYGFDNDEDHCFLKTLRRRRFRGAHVADDASAAAALIRGCRCTHLRFSGWTGQRRGRGRWWSGSTGFDYDYWMNCKCSICSRVTAAVYRERSTIASLRPAISIWTLSGCAPML
jgi:hypothetical protein